VPLRVPCCSLRTRAITSLREGFGREDANTTALDYSAGRPGRRGHIPRDNLVVARLAAHDGASVITASTGRSPSANARANRGISKAPGPAMEMSFDRRRLRGARSALRRAAQGDGTVERLQAMPIRTPRQVRTLEVFADARANAVEALRSSSLSSLDAIESPSM